MAITSQQELDFEKQLADHEAAHEIRLEEYEALNTFRAAAQD